MVASGVIDDDISDDEEADITKVEGKLSDVLKDSADNPPLL